MILHASVHQLGPRSGSSSLGYAISVTSQLCRRRSFRSTYRPRSGSSDKASVVVCDSQTRSTRCDSRQSFINERSSYVDCREVRKSFTLSRSLEPIPITPQTGPDPRFISNGVHFVHTYGSFSPCPFRFAPRVLPHSPFSFILRCTAQGGGGGSSEKRALLRTKVHRTPLSAPLQRVLVRTRTIRLGSLDSLLGGPLLGGPKGAPQGGPPGGAPGGARPPGPPGAAPRAPRPGGPRGAPGRARPGPPKRPFLGP